MTIEIWKDIIGYEGIYKISNYIKVKSLRSSYSNYREKILKLKTDSKGYLYITLFKKKVSKNYRISRLMLETFVGPCPLGMECCHNDGNNKNDDLNNLRWDTHKNNMNDKKIHGTFVPPPRNDHNGSKSPNAKLNDNKIRQIRILYLEGKSKTEISKLFNVSIKNIWNIVNYKTWKDVK